MAEQADLLPGTLDVLILKSVSLGPLHGYAVLARIEQITQGALLVEQGALSGIQASIAAREERLEDEIKLEQAPAAAPAYAVEVPHLRPCASPEAP